MSSKAKPAKAPPDMAALIALTKSTQDLLAHFQASLAPSAVPKTQTDSSAAPSDLPDPLQAIKASTTLLRSHTTMLSLLLLTPPLTPSALVSKIGDVSSGALSGMVAASTAAPLAGRDELGAGMRLELRAQVRRLLGTWGDILGLVLKLAEKRKGAKGKDEGPTEAERQEVLATTGVVWEACDALLKTCNDGVVGLVVKKAGEYRSTLLDAIEELKEWGEDVDEDEDKAEGSGAEDEFGDEDDLFGAANKLGKDDKELKEFLDKSVKKLKMIGMLYQALIKRRLKTFQNQSSSSATTNGATSGADLDTIEKLDKLMEILKMIPETVDDLASAFYDLDEDEAKETLTKCMSEAKSAVDLTRKSRTGQDDEFTAWSEKWIGALEGA